MPGECRKAYLIDTTPKAIITSLVTLPFFFTLWQNHGQVPALFILIFFIVRHLFVPAVPGPLLSAWLLLADDGAIRHQFHSVHGTHFRLLWHAAEVHLLHHLQRRHHHLQNLHILKAMIQSRPSQHRLIIIIIIMDVCMVHDASPSLRHNELNKKLEQQSGHKIQSQTGPNTDPGSFSQRVRRLKVKLE